MTNPYKPWRAVIVGIDPGAVSGVSIWLCGKYRLSAVVRTALQREDWIDEAYVCALTAGLPLVFIAEDWPSPYMPNGQRLGNRVLRGMGMNWGKWLQEIEKLPKPNKIPKAKVMRVPVMEWRRQYQLHKKSKKEAKKYAIKLCQTFMHRNIKDDNEAEAVLIGEFGCRWSELGKIKGLERCE